MSNNNVTKKFSRRKAGNYGRPGSKAQKRIASKSARRFNAIDPKNVTVTGPYFVTGVQPDEDISEIIKREKEEEMADEIEREESLFYNEKFGSDSEFEQQIFDGAGR